MQFFPDYRITLTWHLTGTQATATTTVENGKIIDITITCAGSGYTSPPDTTYLFVDNKVAAHGDGVWTTGMVQSLQCLHQEIMPSMTRTLPVDTLLPNKSQSFSIVRTDNTDSICDLPSVLTFLDNHASNWHHRANTNRSSPSSSLPEPLLPPHNPPASAPASDAGIFTGRAAALPVLVSNMSFA
jgi:hypothetical protein